MTDDPFPLVEETDDPTELPTIEEWLEGGAPMREIEEEPCQQEPRQQ